MKIGDVVVVAVSIFVVVICSFLLYYHHLETTRRRIESEGKFDGDVNACGKKSKLSVGVNEWPWLSAFVFWPDLEYFCGGSLISTKHVLTGEQQQN